MGRALVAIGIALVIAGVILILGEKLGWKPGRLPGDIVIERPGTSFYFPVVTCAILSIFLTVLLSLLAWLFNRR